MPAASRKLPKHDDLIVRYAMLAERYVFDLPNSSLSSCSTAKLRICYDEINEELWREGA